MGRARPRSGRSRCGATPRRCPTRQVTNRHKGSGGRRCRVRRASRDLLGVELLLKLETANPTHSFKDRLAASAVAAAEEFGLDTVCCVSGRQPRRGARRARGGPRAAGGRARAGGGRARRRRSRGPAARRRWPCAAATRSAARSGSSSRRGSAGASSTGRWGRSRSRARRRSRSRSPSSSAACPTSSSRRSRPGRCSRRSRRGSRELDAVGLGPAALPRMVGAQPGGCPPLAAAFAERRPPSRVKPRTEARSLAIGDPRYGDLALGAAHVSGGSIRSVPEERIRANSALLAEAAGVFADSAAGVALGALRQCVSDGSVAEGETVVLVVTGTPARPLPVGDVARRAADRGRGERLPVGVPALGATRLRRSAASRRRSAAARRP